jgi:hypothetical protein
MDLKQSPFQSAWFGTALENVGLVDQRPYVGTYGQYEYDALPPYRFPRMTHSGGWRMHPSTSGTSVRSKRRKARVSFPN